MYVVLVTGKADSQLRSRELEVAYHELVLHTKHGAPPIEQEVPILGGDYKPATIGDCSAASDTMGFKSNEVHLSPV